MPFSITSGQSCLVLEWRLPTRRDIGTLQGLDWSRVVRLSLPRSHAKNLEFVRVGHFFHRCSRNGCRSWTLVDWSLDRLALLLWVQFSSRARRLPGRCGADPAVGIVRSVRAGRIRDASANRSSEALGGRGLLPTREKSDVCRRCRDSPGASTILCRPAHTCLRGHCLACLSCFCSRVRGANFVAAIRSLV